MSILSSEQILHIVKCQGWFEASWRYRDEFLREKLHRMNKNGLLVKVPGIKG